jgi:hypothetical protein
MSPLKTYSGYFENGRFVTKNNVPIPDYANVLVTVLEKTMTDETEYLCSIPKMKEKIIEGFLSLVSHLSLMSLHEKL